ncbi:MAG: CBS domain-containing protein [Nanoarchaeota archaeon]
MQVKEVMSKNVVTCTSEETVSEITKRLMKYDIGMLVVVEDTISKMPIGVVTDRDVLNRVLLKNLNAEKTSVANILTKSIISINVNESLAHAVETMRKNKVKRLVVLDESKMLVGIISNSDIIKQFLEIRQKLLDLSVGF